ncbi:MAG: HEAT repeat domain-containing protein [Isosphaeraceae bacterium]
MMVSADESRAPAGRRRVGRWISYLVCVAGLGIASLTGQRLWLAWADRGAEQAIRYDPGVGPFYRPEDEPPTRVPRGTRVRHPLLEAVRSEWKPSGEVFPIASAGWKARMAALCGLAREGRQAVPVLTAILDDRDPRVRSVAAQALGILGDTSVEGVLEAMLLGDPDAECRVYAAHARSMLGGMQQTPRYQWSLSLDRLFSFRDQLQFALDRGPEPAPPAIRQAYAQYDLSLMDSARVGKPAPDFVLPTPDGKSSIRLHEVLAESDVMLVFIYGST